MKLGTLETQLTSLRIDLRSYGGRRRQYPLFSYSVHTQSHWEMTKTQSYPAEIMSVIELIRGQSMSLEDLTVGFYENILAYLLVIS